MAPKWMKGRWMSFFEVAPLPLMVFKNLICFIANENE